MNGTITPKFPGTIGRTILKVLCFSVELTLCPCRISPGSGSEWLRNASIGWAARGLKDRHRVKGAHSSVRTGHRMGTGRGAHRGAAVQRQVQHTCGQSSAGGSLGQRAPNRRVLKRGQAVLLPLQDPDLRAPGRIGLQRAVEAIQKVLAELCDVPLFRAIRGCG